MRTCSCASSEGPVRFRLCLRKLYYPTSLAPAELRRKQTYPAISRQHEDHDHLSINRLPALASKAGHVFSQYTSSIPVVIHAHPYLLLSRIRTFHGALMLPPTCMLRAVQRCDMTGKPFLAGEYNIWNMALSVKCCDLHPYTAFRVSLHIANAGDRRHR